MLFQGEEAGPARFVEEDFGEEEKVVSLPPEFEKPGPPPDLGVAEPSPAEPFRPEVGEEKIVSVPPEFELPGERDFGKAEKGMPGDGYTGSFVAEPYRGEPFLPEKEEPLLPEKEEDKVASLPLEEEVRGRLLPYRSSYLLKNINFAFDRYDLDGNSRAILERNMAFLKAHDNLKVEIQGHCDERGTNSYNISLGDRRAQSAKSYLIALGVDESRIRTISYGEERPFCLESNEMCWFQNRRAHFLVAVAR